MMEDVNLHNQGGGDAAEKGEASSSNAIMDIIHGDGGSTASSPRAMANTVTTHVKGFFSDTSDEGKKKKKYLLFGTAFLVVILLIALPISASKKRNGAPDYGPSGGSETLHYHPNVTDPGTITRQNVPNKQIYNKIVKHTQEYNISTVPLSYDNSPQYKAYLWLATENDNLDKYPETYLLQRYALATLYYATTQIKTMYTTVGHDKTWVRSDNWLTNMNECGTDYYQKLFAGDGEVEPVVEIEDGDAETEGWFGVSCNQNNRVVAIRLEDNDLTGSLPPELVFINAQLHTLKVTSNYLYMEGAQLDVFGYLTELKHLFLDDNYITSDTGIPNSFGKLHKLEKLVLSYNLISGPFHTNNNLLRKIGSAKGGLEHLEIESNDITGKLPESLGEMTNLKYLYLRRNELSINLDFIDQLSLSAGDDKAPELYSLWLDDNKKIDGTIPKSIGLLTNLASVSIMDGSLTGSIPDDVQYLTDLKRIWLNNNKLTGTIPSGWGAIGNENNLEVVELHNNKLSGNVPNSLCYTLQQSTYVDKSLTVDCSTGNIECNCCTKCY